MTENDVNVKGGKDSELPTQWVMGKAVAYQSTIWRIKGLYLTAMASGGREVCWILGKLEKEVTELDTEGGRQ